MMLFVKKVGVLRNLTRSQVDAFVNDIPCDLDYVVKGNLLNDDDDDCDKFGINKYKLIIFRKEK